MENHNFNTVKVKDGTEIALYTAIPEGEGPFPALIVIQEAFGVNHHIRTLAERYCQEGYAVVSPDLFHRTAVRIEVDYDDFSKAAPHFHAITKEGLTADLQAAYDFLASNEQVLQEKAGAVGYCLGGRVSFLANAVLPLSAAVSYYGGGLEQFRDEAEHLHGTHLFYWGGLDQHIGEEAIQTITGAVKQAGKDYENIVFSYADHGFNCDERASYHPLAAKEAWAHTLAFFNGRLK